MTGRQQGKGRGENREDKDKSSICVPRPKSFWRKGISVRMIKSTQRKSGIPKRGRNIKIKGIAEEEWETRTITVQHPELKGFVFQVLCAPVPLP